MMNKQLVIDAVRAAKEYHFDLVDQGQILIDGLNTDSAMPPEDCTECHFGKWFYTEEGSTLRDFVWYTELKQQHEELHSSYSVLYYESMRMYNPKPRNELLERFTTLILKRNALSKKLDEVESILEKISDTEFVENLVEALAVEEQVEETEFPEEQTNDAIHNLNEDESGKNSNDNDDKGTFSEADSEKIDDLIDPLDERVNEVLVQDSDKMQDIDIHSIESDSFEVDVLEEKNSNEVESLVETPVKSSHVDETISNSTNPTSDLMLKLKEQDIVQLSQEKELTETELSQLKERQKLTQQSIQQLEQYYLAKQQEFYCRTRRNYELRRSSYIYL